MLPTPALSPAMTPTSDCGSLGRGYLHGEAGESRETKSIALALPGTLEKNHLKVVCLKNLPAGCEAFPSGGGFGGTDWDSSIDLPMC